MTKCPKPLRAAACAVSRARVPIRLGAPLAAALPCALLVTLLLASPAQAFKPVEKGGENTPLNISSGSGGSHATSSGPSIVRTIVGLLIVVAVIWGLTWILRQVKSGRDGRTEGSGLASLASLPLGSGRSLHVVRAGSEILVVGSSEHGVVPIHRYTEQQAIDVGLIDPAAPGTIPGLGAERLVANATSSATATSSASTTGEASPVNLVDRLREWTVRR